MSNAKVEIADIGCGYGGLLGMFGNLFDHQIILSSGTFSFVSTEVDSRNRDPRDCSRICEAENRKTSRR